jgi:L-rhamnose-H+ transport protein
MKKFVPLSWEAYWLVFSLAGMIVIPFIWTKLAVPDMWTAIHATSTGDLLTAIIFGALWGIGAILFGLSINYLGVALGNGIPMGLASAAGSLIPLFKITGVMSKPSTPFVLTGVFIMLIGLGVLTIAGIRRDKLTASGAGNTEGVKQGKQFILGLLFAILSGLLSAFANIGFSKALSAAHIAQANGASLQNASLVAWIIVFWGNFIVSLFYSLYLLFKNKSFSTFTGKGSIKGIIWAVLTGFMWYAALGIYGQGAALMGEIGPVIGWSMFLALALVMGSFWGIVYKEWKGVKKPLILMLIGNAVLIISFICLGYANSLN